MQKTLSKFGLAILTIFLLSAFATPPSKSYKCMLQLVNYQGEGAYIIVSVLDAEGQYQETLRVIGKDAQWYPDLKEWYAYFTASKQEVDGLSGATIAGGERTVFSFHLNEKYINSEHVLRIETAVEDQEYHIDDVKLPILAEAFSGKVEGSGYVRYIKLLEK